MRVSRADRDNDDRSNYHVNCGEVKPYPHIRTSELPPMPRRTTFRKGDVRRVVSKFDGTNLLDSQQFAMRSSPYRREHEKI